MGGGVEGLAETSQNGTKRHFGLYFIIGIVCLLEYNFSIVTLLSKLQNGVIVTRRWRPIAKGHMASECEMKYHQGGQLPRSATLTLIVTIHDTSYSSFNFIFDCSVMETQFKKPVFFLNNALKLTYCNVQFKNISGAEKVRGWGLGVSEYDNEEMKS